jgi:CheY-like chemotaxis protein
VDSEEGEWSEFTVDFPFDLEPSDTTEASNVLDNVSVLHVCSDEQDTEWENLQRNNLDCHRFRTLGEIDDFLHSRKSMDPKRFYMYLVQEELFQADTYHRVASMAPNSLVTLGPKYSVKESCGHFRSISQVLPSVLMKSLASRIDVMSKRAVSGTDLPKDLADQSISYEEIKVLIAEDNLINQKVLGRMLSRIGVKHIDVVDNGQKAVNQEAERGDYDMVFMDMQMPVMGGLEATQLIVKRRGEQARPKIVFVTANVSYGFEEEAIAAGGDGFISKPFNKIGIEKAFNLLRS